MRILDRYLLREFLTPFGYCLGGFFIFWLTFQLFSELDEFQRAGLSVIEVAYYFIYTLPELLLRVVPFGLLLAMLYAINNHNKYNEIVAIRGAGISLWRISYPYFLVSIVCGLFLFVLNEYLMPDGAERAMGILRGDYVKGEKGEEKNLIKFLTFKNAKANRTWVIEEYDPESSQMIKPHIEWESTNKTIYSLIAERGLRTNGVWTFYNVQVLVFKSGDPVPGRGFTNILAVPEFTETPEQIKSEIKIGGLTDLKQARGVSLSLKEIVQYQQIHPDQRRNPVLNTKFHVRLAQPFTCPVIVLIALPFARLGSRRNVFVGVASSVFIGFGYFVVQRFGEAAGMGGHLNPLFAGWLPNILFAVLGFVMILRAR
ncbi:MAG: LptF/LptG family permease [Verrucomicrobiia bacterium]